MDIKGFMYALARRPDSDELRELGRELMEQVWKCGDPALAMGFLLNDWMKLMEESGLQVDKPVDGLLRSPRGTEPLQ